MTTTPAVVRTPARTPRVRAIAAPSALRIGRARAVLEVRQFFRNKGAMFFTFSMPLVMFLLLASIFDETDKATGVSTQQVYVTGMLAMGVMSTCLQSLALQVGGERHNGTLKRLRATPMPPAAYFLGKIAMVVVTSLVQAAILLGLGAAFFGLELPADPGRWFTFVWVYLLGATACTLIGLVASNLVKGENGGPVVLLPVMVLQFISGVFVIFSQLPKGVQIVSAVFPLKWMCQGMRSVFLPDAYASVEPAGGWEHGRTAMVLAAWVVVGAIMCLKWFRWKGEDEG
ncbi:ABC transporter permease [Yinghuangia seranimata]|uniref:ABC transporter permease n=1 Tax=Yinghuangia seranimata TaxID=408067 RepID=UPI00248C8F18|nr:ABC transporter permease [Yinghuangia seranimata]MDI2130248.1 ABC transporter permease [Yinghuangia seranimata]